jgi:hypothetical protein
MSDDPTGGPGRADDATPAADTAGGRNTDVSSPNAGPQAADLPQRAFGEVQATGENPYEGEEASEELDASSPSEGTPEDLKPGGDRPGLDPDDGADAGDHGRETAP